MVQSHHPCTKGIWRDMVLCGLPQVECPYHKWPVSTSSHWWHVWPNRQKCSLVYLRFMCWVLSGQKVVIINTVYQWHWFIWIPLDALWFSQYTRGVPEDHGQGTGKFSYLDDIVVYPGQLRTWIYWMFYDHLSAHSLLTKLGRWVWLMRIRMRLAWRKSHWVHKIYIQNWTQSTITWFPTLPLSGTADLGGGEIHTQ